MGWFSKLGDQTGPLLRRVAVIVMFLIVPAYVWWQASPMIENLPITPGVQLLLFSSVFATLSFGAVSGFLVWRDLDLEP